MEEQQKVETKEVEQQQKEQQEKQQEKPVEAGSEQQEKKESKKKKKQANKPFTYDFKEEIANLDRSVLSQRLNVPKSYEVPKQFIQKPKPEFLVGNVLRIDTVLSEPERFYDRNAFICGWVKATRVQGGGSMLFLEISDGSCLKGIQVVVDKSIANFEEATKCLKDSSFKFYGKLVKSAGKGQAIELSLTEEIHRLEILGKQQKMDYPMPKETRDLLHISKEQMREHAHLRPRTRLISCIARIRNNLAQATHLFFSTNAFQYIHTPLITASDCEGAGEMFQVTTLLHDKGKKVHIKDVKLDEKTKDIDYKNDFFKKPSFLTVSGQLSVENYCCALSNVYTFGPTFRAECSNSTRHLAEFWMIEPELAFADNIDNMDCAEAYIKFCLQYILTNNQEDLDFLTEYQQKEHEKKLKDDEKIHKIKHKVKPTIPMLKEYIQKIYDQPFERITYTDAMTILQKAVAEGKVFEEDPNPTWEGGLATEHEKFLCDYVFHKPVMVYNYPKEVKAFYMRLNEDKKTVACVDVLVPGVGELVGGAQREERIEVLEERMAELGLDKEDYWWYLQLREFGTIPHCGFGLGFERLVMLTTGTMNVKDVIPFPRQFGVAEF